MEPLQIVIGLAVVLLLVGIYILVVVLNRKTKVPKGCELAYLEATCGACMSKTCEIRKKEDVVV